MAEIAGAAPPDLTADTPVEDTQEETEVVENETVEVDPPDPYSNVFDVLKEHNVDTTKWKTGKDAVASLVQAQRLVGHRDERAKLGQWLEENPRAVAAELIRRGYAAVDKPQGQVATEAPKDFEPAWLQDIIIAEDGSVRARPGGEKSLNAYNAWATEYQKTVHQRARDPLANPEVQQRLKTDFVPKEDFENFRQQFANIVQDYQIKSIADNWSREIASWAFNDQKNLQSGFTHYGALFSNYVRQAEADGVADHEKQNRRAYEAVMNQMRLDGVTAKNNGKPRNPTGAQRRTSSEPGKGEKPFQPGKESFEELMTRRIKDAVARGDVTSEEAAQGWF